MPKRITPEASLLSAVLDLLAAEKIWHERRNTGAFKAEHEGRKRFVRFSRKGTADVMATPCFTRRTAGNLYSHVAMEILWIETKAKSAQSPEQKAFQAEVEAAGHTYLLIRDVDQLRDWLRSKGVGR